MLPRPEGESMVSDVCSHSHLKIDGVALRQLREDRNEHRQGFQLVLNGVKCGV